MKKKNLFWSYSKVPDSIDIIIEHSLKYGDLDDIKALIIKYGNDKCQAVWERIIVPDQRFKKLNYFLARFIFKAANNDTEVKAFLSARNKTRGEIINEIFNR